jgi:poly(A) polymerase
VAPRIVERSEHIISRRDICPYALKVLYRLLRNDHTAYLVGGGVRDLLLGRAPKDFDVSTDASPAQIKRLFRNCWLIGRRFRLAHIRYGETIIETATFRRNPTEAEAEEGEARKRREKEGDQDLYVRSDNSFGTPCEDAFRRDFTINGLFYDVGSFAVIDYVGGLKDLEKKMIRCIGDPNIRFREDPVRMLRAVRFASRLGFKIERTTQKALLEHAPELSKASPPRLMEEMGRFFAFGAGEAAMRLLYKTGLLSGLLPFIAEYLDAAAPRVKTRYWKYLKQLDAYTLKEEKVHQPLVFATLIYPILYGKKVEERSLHEDLECIRSYGHKFNDCLSFPRKLRESLNQLLSSQIRLQMKNSRRFRRRKFAGRQGFDDVLALTRIAVEVDGLDPKPLEEWAQLRQEILASRGAAQEKADAEGEAEETPAREERDSSRSGRRRSRRRGRRRRQHDEEMAAIDEGGLDALAEANAEGVEESTAEPVEELVETPASEPVEVEADLFGGEEEEVSGTAEEEEESGGRRRSRDRHRRRRRSPSQIRQFSRDDTPILHTHPLGLEGPHWLEEV